MNNPRDENYILNGIFITRVAHQLKSKEKNRYNKDYKKTEYAKTRRSTLRN